MFGIDNKYRRWYFELVSRPDEGEYTERHHIVPRCLGGSNEPENLVKLSYRKHFLAHWLLTKFTEGQSRGKLLQALGYMSNAKKQRIISSWQYDVARRGHNLAKVGTKQSTEHKAKVILAIKGQRWITNGTIDKKTRGEIPIGWRLGRIELPQFNSIGKKLSSEHKAKISVGIKGRCWINDGKINKRIAGEIPKGWKIGRINMPKRSAEARAKQSKALRGKPKSPSHIEKIRGHWITDGVITKKIAYDMIIPCGWRIGMGPRNLSRRSISS